MTPHPIEKIVAELRNRPFSIPIGQGTYVGLVCPDCSSQRFHCLECASNWLRTTLTTFESQIRENIAKEVEKERFKYEPPYEGQKDEQMERDWQNRVEAFTHAASLIRKGTG